MTRIIVTITRYRFIVGNRIVCEVDIDPRHSADEKLLAYCNTHALNMARRLIFNNGGSASYRVETHDFDVKE